MRIGIFAGTFDPMHNGHLEFANTAIAKARLDKVIVVAEKEPYRKKPHASWDHRQAMIERATEAVKNIDHDYGFAAKLAHQHTMKDMLGVAKAHYGNGNEYWFLVGSDVFEHMHQWHDLMQAEDYGGFVVALRDDHTPEWLAAKRELVDEKLGETIVVPSPRPHVSSSKIREEAPQKAFSEDVPPNIIEYIQSHHLYNG